MSNRDIYRSRWETIINEELTIEDLDENEILKTVRLGIESGRLPENTGTDITEILTRFELINHGKIKNAAAVLFAKRSLSDYPQCMLRLARFKGYNKTEFIDNRQVKGNLFVLLDAAMTFVFKHLSISGIVEGLERKERLSIPYPAIREGVINSLCHRQYRTLGASVGIAIYDDRLEIENPGSFPNDWDINELKTEHRSNPSNPLIANVLYKRKLLESWGRGIGLMVEECVKQGLPEPEFKMVNGFVVVTFRYTNDSLTTDKHLELLPQQHGKELARSWQGVGRELGIDLDVLSTICEFCLEPKSLLEIADHLNLHDRYKMKKKYIDPILGKLIRMTIPEKPNSSKQRYVTICRKEDQE